MAKQLLSWVVSLVLPLGLAAGAWILGGNEAWVWVALVLTPLLILLGLAVSRSPSAGARSRAGIISTSATWRLSGVAGWSRVTIFP